MAEALEQQSLMYNASDNAKKTFEAKANHFEEQTNKLQVSIYKTNMKDLCPLHCRNPTFCLNVWVKIMYLMAACYTFNSYFSRYLTVCTAIICTL